MTKRGWFWCVVVAVVGVSLIRAMIMDATNPEVIKKRAAGLGRQAAPTTTAVTQQRIEGSRWWGCTDRDYQDKLTGYLVDGDMAAFEAAWVHGKVAGLCVTFTDGELVYVADTAIWSGLIKVRRHGELQEYWTNIEALGR